MLKLKLGVFLFLLCTVLSYSQAPDPRVPKFRASFIKSWYCNSWDAVRWEKEFNDMKDAGFKELIIQSTFDISRRYRL